MADGAWEIVGLDDRKLPFEKTVGDAVRDLVRQRHKNNAAKMIERRWGVDPKTAKNVVSEGIVSTTTLTKAARAERWALWNALGEELFGETYEQHLQNIIEETNRASDRMENRRRRLRDLEARAASLVAVGDGMGAE